MTVTADRLWAAAVMLATIAVAFKMGMDWEETRPVLARIRRRATVRLAKALIVLAGALMLAGCSPSVVDAPADFSGGVSCYPPLACGPLYPVVVYPYAVHPYLGYLHDPAHTVIITTGGRTSVTYRPYSPPLRPAFAPTVPRTASGGTGAKPAAPKPAQAKPAAPKPAAPARVSTRK